MYVLAPKGITMIEHVSRKDKICINMSQATLRSQNYNFFKSQSLHYFNMYTVVPCSQRSLMQDMFILASG